MDRTIVREWLSVIEFTQQPLFRCPSIRRGGRKAWVAAFPVSLPSRVPLSLHVFPVCLSVLRASRRRNWSSAPASPSQQVRGRFTASGLPRVTSLGQLSSQLPDLCSLHPRGATSTHVQATGQALAVCPPAGPLPSCPLSWIPPQGLLRAASALSVAVEGARARVTSGR